MNQSTVFWGLILILGFPFLSVVLGEGFEYLQRQGNPLAKFVQTLRMWLLPLLAIMVLMEKLLGLKSSELSVQVVETAIWVATIYTVICLLNALLTTGTTQKNWQIHVPNLLFQFARAFVILSIFAYVIAHVWNFNLSKVIQALGVGSLVMALALQDTISNLVSGFLLIFESPLKVGDWVSVKGVEGQVIEINWRAVRIKNLNQDTVIIPNSLLGKDIIKNYSLPVRSHADRLYVSFWREDSPNRIQNVLKNTALATKGIVSDPPPDVRLIAFEGYGTKYEIIFYVDSFAELELIRNNFMTRVHYAARRNGLNIAVPNTSVQINGQFKFDGDLINQDNHQQTILEVLQTIPYFRSLDSSTIDLLTESSSLEGFAIGERIVWQDEFDTGFYIILNGSVLLSVIDIRSQEQEVTRLSKGDFFGEMVFLRGERSPVSVTVTDDLKAIRIPPDTIFNLTHKNPRFSLEMNQFVEERKKAARMAKGTQTLANPDIAAKDKESSQIIQQIRDNSDN